MDRLVKKGQNSDFRIEMWLKISSPKAGLVSHLAEVINKYICKMFSGLALSQQRLLYETSQSLSLNSIGLISLEWSTQTAILLKLP